MTDSNLPDDVTPLPDRAPHTPRRPTTRRASAPRGRRGHARLADERRAADRFQDGGLDGGDPGVEE